VRITWVRGGGPLRTKGRILEKGGFNEQNGCPRRVPIIGLQPTMPIWLALRAYESALIGEFCPRVTHSLRSSYTTILFSDSTGTKFEVMAPEADENSVLIDLLLPRNSNGPDGNER